MKPRLLGQRRQRGEQRDRLEAGDLGVAALAAAEADRQAVGQEIGVEQPALGGLRQPAVELETGGAVGRRVGMAPGGDVLAAAGEEGAELDRSGHLVLLSEKASESEGGSRRLDSGRRRG